MKKIFYIYYVVGSLLGLNSCADLDITPASSIDKDEFYRSAEDVESAVNGIYAIFTNWPSDLSGRSRTLLPSSPLRTVREGFPSYGSSFSKSLFVCRDRLILLLVSIVFTG